MRGLLGEGEVTIYNIGPDKYNGRVVADVATRRTDNVSAALLAAGHARSYGGGHRSRLVCGLIFKRKSRAAARLCFVVIPGRWKSSNPESRDSGSHRSRPGMTKGSQRVTTTVVPTETR